MYEKQKILYNGDYWKEYRIGDLYRFGTFIGCGEKNPKCENDDYHNIHFPHSIAHYYSIFNNPKKQTNKEALHKAVEKVNSTYNIERIECCLHIRVGDVMNMNDNKAKTYSKKGDIAWWNNTVTWLKNNQIKNIAIMAGSHFNVNPTNSLNYIEDRKQFLEKNRFNVTLRLGNSPDEDILTAYNSKYFITTGGTYGKLMKDIASINDTVILS